MSQSLALSPAGHLFVQPDDQAEPKLSPAVMARLTEGFGDSSAGGLELLASEFLHEPLPPTFVFWRGLARRLFTALCHQPHPPDTAPAIPKPSEAECSALAEGAPPMTGLEYLTGAVVAQLWDELAARGGGVFTKP